MMCVSLLYYFSGVVYTYLGAWFFIRRYNIKVCDDEWPVIWIATPFFWPASWLLAGGNGVYLLIKGELHGTTD